MISTMILLVAAMPLAPSPTISSPATAVAAAATDSLSIPKQDRRYQRYLWVPEPVVEREIPKVGTASTTGVSPGSTTSTTSTPTISVEKRAEQLQKHYEKWWLITKIQANLLSTEGKFGNPLVIAPGVLRLDVRDYGWDKKLEIWEKLAAIDYVFHSKAKLLVPVTRTVVWVGGKDEKGVEWDAGLYPTKFNEGDILDIPAAWISAVPLMDGMGKPLVDKEGNAISAIDYLRQELLTEVPIVMASWWFVQTARQTDLKNNDEPGTGYYDWLGIKDRNAFFELTGVDEKKAISLFSELREVVVKSGISQQNRQIVRLGSSGAQGSGVWGTLDTFNQSGRGIATENIRRGEFAHNAEEWYGTLPNGLFVTFLGDQNGKRAATAPDKIGPDSSSLCIGNDKRVHANLSCIRCHGVDKDYLKPIDGWARKTFRLGGVLRLQDKDKKIQSELESNYLREMDVYLQDDRVRYLRSTAALTVMYATDQRGRLLIGKDGKPVIGKPPLTAPLFTKLYGGVWNSYVEEDLTLEAAAMELGIQPDVFFKNLSRHKTLIVGGQIYVDGRKNLTLSAFLDEPPQKIMRLSWEAIYPVAMMIGLGLDPPEVPTQVKKLP